MYNKLNDYQQNGSTILIDGKSFNNDLRVELFTKQKSLKPQVGLSIALNRLLSAFVEVGYNIPLSNNDGIRFTDKPDGFFKSLFPSSKEVSLNSAGSIYTLNGKPDTHPLYRSTYSFSIGLNGLIRFRK